MVRLTRTSDRAGRFDRGLPAGAAQTVLAGRAGGCRRGRLDGAQSAARTCPGRRTSRPRCCSRPLRGRSYGCPELECPYFERDPRLDPAELPQPGWLFDVELGIMGSHVVEQLGQTDPAGQITVAVPGTGHTGDVVACRWPGSIGPFLPALNWAIGCRRGLGKWTLPTGFCWPREAARRPPARSPAPTQPPR